MSSLRKKDAQVSTTISATHQKFLSDYKKNKTKIRIAQWSIIIAFLLLWELSTHLGWLNSFIFSSPSRVVKTILTMTKDGALFYHTGITLLETFISFALVISLGLLTAIILWWNDNLAKVLEPYLVILNSLPKTALAPIFIVWLGNNMKTIIVAAVSVAIFGSILTLYSNFQAVEEDKKKLIYTFGGTKKDILFKVILPSNIPSIISVMKVNIGLSLVGVIIGEFLAAKAGLGYLIIYGSQVFKLDWVIMSIVILCIVASGLYGILSYVEKRVKRS